MDANTLQLLGISKEELAERVVAKAVEVSIHASRDSGWRPLAAARAVLANGFNPRQPGFRLAALAAEHLIPRVGEMIERANMRQTNRYGEDKSPPMTFLEYIASRAEAYMSEDVDINGKSKAEGDSYSWRSCGPRLTVLMRMYIKDSLEKHATAAVSDVNKVIAKNIEKAARDAITAAASSIKVQASA